jgi:glycosyltransferase involved in cell wall biosynthesis
MAKQPTAIICLSHHSGGMEIDSIKLAKKLCAHVPITLIAKSNCFIAKSQDDYVGYNGLELETIPFLSSMSLSIVLSVRRIVREKGIKNIIFFGASELKSLYFSFLGLDINLIVRHGTTKSHPKKDWFHRLIYSNVKTHVSICKHLEKNVKYIIPFGKQTRSAMIYPSLEFPEIEKTLHDTLTLIHVGRIVEGKGQADALQACQILYEKGIDFIFYLVGGLDAHYEQPFMELYDSLPYKEKIILVGFTKNVADYYAKADIFLFPSHGEGLGNAFLEALSNDLVCITYNNTSFPELQELGLYCHLCENRNIESVKNALLESVTHLSDQISLATHNRQTMERIFSMQREINEHLDLLI